MTKTEYAKYLQSPRWKARRLEAIAESGDVCERCRMPRWLVEIIYDQDLHVHHLSYATLGSEEYEDLEVLCRRCHDLETFGRSDLREVQGTRCELCSEVHWNRRSDLCTYCLRLFDLDGTFSTSLMQLHPSRGVPMWRIIMDSLFRAIGGHQGIKDVVDELVRLAEMRSWHPSVAIEDDEADS